MIKIIQGDLMQAKEDIIGHSVNAMGVMGSGVAYQIKKQYPNVFKEYVDFVRAYEICPIHLLGKCQIVSIDGVTDKYVANLFGQFSFGTLQTHTEYDKLKKALHILKVSAKDHNKSVALPYRIGCGLGGGDWDIVYKMIDEIFHDYEVILYNIEE